MGSTLADSRAPVAHNHASWRSIVASYLALALVPVGLWAVSQPISAAAVLVTVVGLSLGVQRGNRLVRCFQDCQRLAFDLGGFARITVARLPADDPS